jgi:hypothetical protein
MKNIRYVCTAAASMGLFCGWVAFAGAEQAGDKPVMFVQSAPEASVKDGKLTLMSPSTTFQKSGMTGHMPCNKFITAWSNGDESFKTNPPNAVLSAYTPNGEPKKMDVSLRNPRFEGPNLVYDVNFISGSAPQGMSAAALFMNDIRLASTGDCTIWHCEVNGG